MVDINKVITGIEYDIEKHRSLLLINHMTSRNHSEIIRLSKFNELPENEINQATVIAFILSSIWKTETSAYQRITLSYNEDKNSHLTIHLMVNEIREKFIFINEFFIGEDYPFPKAIGYAWMGSNAALKELESILFL